MPQFLQTSDCTYINVDEIHSAQVNPDGSITLGVHSAGNQIVKGDYAAALLKVLGVKSKEHHAEHHAAKSKDK